MARVKIGNVEGSKTLSADATEASFEFELQTGPRMLQGWLTNEAGKEYGPYFVKVRKM